MKYTYDALNLLTEKAATGSENRATLEEIVSGNDSANTAAGMETITTRYTYDMLESYRASLNLAMKKLSTLNPIKDFGIYGNWELVLIQSQV